MIACFKWDRPKAIVVEQGVAAGFPGSRKYEITAEFDFGYFGSEIVDPLMVTTIMAFLVSKNGFVNNRHIIF